MFRNKDRTLFFILPLIGILLFIILVFLSALAYDGGNKLNPAASGYSFSNNYLSDLGRAKTLNGLENNLPFYCFNGSLIILCPIFVLYFLYLPILYSENKKTLTVARIGSLFGVFGSICFAGVGFTPVDLYFSSHVFFANWLYRCYCITIIFYAAAFIFIPKKSQVFATAFIIIGMIVAAHILLSDIGLADHFTDSHKIHVLSQKASSIALVFAVPMMVVYNRWQLSTGPVSLSIFALKT